MSQPRPLLSPPETEEQLLAQAQQLSGYTLGELAALAGLVTPENLKRDKGWIGVLLEIWLGASAGSKPEQDFAALGVELKTIPVDSLGRPLETTFVCVAPLTGNSGVTWETSHVRHKLKRVLWIPVEGERSIPLAQRRVGSPLLWSPNEEEDRQLREDWEELMDMIVLGQVESDHRSSRGIFTDKTESSECESAYRSHWCPGRTDSDAATRLLFEEEFHQCTTGPSFSDPVAIALTCRFPGI